MPLIRTPAADVPAVARALNTAGVQKQRQPGQDRPPPRTRPAAAPGQAGRLPGPGRPPSRARAAHAALARRPRLDRLHARADYARGGAMRLAAASQLVAVALDLARELVDHQAERGGHIR